MGWQLFTWILSAGIFSMFWFLYISIRQDEKLWKPVAQAVSRERKYDHRNNRIANG